MLKRYPLNQSPLYRLRGKGQFASVLGITFAESAQLAESNSYRVFVNLTNREIQHPTGRLKVVHARIAALLKRIELPHYVFSQKGRSYVDNARMHVGPTPLVKTDVSKFYPSTTHAMVWRMFSRLFECADDVAGQLADICCYSQRHLPTGSPLSGYVAFFASQPMFDEVHDHAVTSGCLVTLFVDDIAISGARANKQLLTQVRHVVRDHGHRTKDRKSLTFTATTVKTVTGVVVTAEGVKLPNRRHHAIHAARQQLYVAPQDEAVLLTKQLAARIQEARQIL
jgi:hypothetical protein